MKSEAKRLKYTTCTQFLLCDQGSQLIEYGLMGVLIAVTCLVLITEIGARPGSIFETIRDALPF